MKYSLALQQAPCSYLMSALNLGEKTMFRITQTSSLSSRSATRFSSPPMITQCYCNCTKGNDRLSVQAHIKRTVLLRLRPESLIGLDVTNTNTVQVKKYKTGCKAITITFIYVVSFKNRVTKHFMRQDGKQTAYKTR